MPGRQKLVKTLQASSKKIAEVCFIVAVYNPLSSPYNFIRMCPTHNKKYYDYLLRIPQHIFSKAVKTLHDHTYRQIKLLSELFAICS